MINVVETHLLEHTHDCNYSLLEIDCSNTHLQLFVYMLSQWDLGYVDLLMYPA